jgi:hypothetical protein
MLARSDQVQVCTAKNDAHLASFLTQVAPRMRAGLRAGIDTARYYRELVKEKRLKSSTVPSAR